MSIAPNEHQSNVNAELETKSNSNFPTILNNSGDNNTYTRLHTSAATLSSESDLSLSLDRELEAYTNVVGGDELPAFEVRLISPLGRTPSPIASEQIVVYPELAHREISSFCPNSEYIALHDINAQISPPKEKTSTMTLTRTSSLETIFEGVFLHTLPRQHYSSQRSRVRGGNCVIEKYVRNRCTYNGKENQMPFRRRCNNLNTNSASHVD